MEGMVQIPYTYTDGTFNYSDALYLPEGHSFTEEQIETMKKERFDNWKAFILNPPPAPSTEPDEIPMSPEVLAEQSNGTPE